MPTKLIAGLLASFVLVACAAEEPAMEKTMEKTMEPVMEEKAMSKL